MGNRAVVTVDGSKVGVYLHWNGHQESVHAFLRAAKDLGVRDPTEDASYFYARFVQIIANYVGGTVSVGVEALSQLDTNNGDNGVYVVGAGFAVIRREHAPARETHIDYDLVGRLYTDVMLINQKLLGSGAV